MAKFIVTMGPVEHDGKTYQDGDTIDLKEKAQADALLRVGVIADPKAAQQLQDEPPAA